MATLEPLDRPGHGILLAARHLVGRSRACLLHIDNPQISGEHASIEWKGFGWEVRDLGSRNGTFVDGKRLAPGGRAPLVCGAVVQFAQSGSWKLVDDSAPVAMAVLVTEPGSSESAAVRAQDGILALPPDTEVPDVCIYQNSAGQWIAERHDGEDVIGDRDHVAVGERVFRVHVPESVASTSGVDEHPTSLDGVGLWFAVSKDEEYVEVTVLHRGRRTQLEPRAHHYPLLLLARARLRDRSDPAMPPSSHGWVYQDELVEMLHCSPNRLHTDIYRVRRELGALGIAGAASIVERRATTKQLRIGVEQLDVKVI